MMIFGDFWQILNFRGILCFRGFVNKKFSKIKLTKAIFDVGIVCFPVTEFLGDYALV